MENAAPDSADLPPPRSEAATVPALVEAARCSREIKEDIVFSALNAHVMTT